MNTIDTLWSGTIVTTVHTTQTIAKMPAGSLVYCESFFHLMTKEALIEGLDLALREENYQGGYTIDEDGTFHVGMQTQPTATTKKTISGVLTPLIQQRCPKFTRYLQSQ